LTLPFCVAAGPSRTRTISATEAAKNFGGLVDRVREAKAVYTIERGGVPVAEIGPVAANRCTIADLVALLRRLPRVDEGYLKAVEEGIRALNKPTLPRDLWER